MIKTNVFLVFMIFDVSNYYYDSHSCETAMGIRGMEYNGVSYTFLKNLQGDVVYIVNGNGQVVTEYKYSPYGEVESITGTLASTIGRFNPFRYRSYYHDHETGWYYLNSRYYDPSVARFLNADVVESIVLQGSNLISTNLFAYCLNNPVNYVDHTGKGVFPVESPGYFYKNYRDSVSRWSLTYALKSDGVEYGAIIYSFRVLWITWYFIGETYKGFKTQNWYTVINGLGSGLLTSTGVKWAGRMFWPITNVKIVGFVHTHPKGKTNIPSGPDKLMKNITWIVGLKIFPIAVYTKYKLSINWSW